jgi:hypothetical protein
MLTIDLFEQYKKMLDTQNYHTRRDGMLRDEFKVAIERRLKNTKVCIDAAEIVPEFNLKRLSAYNDFFERASRFPGTFDVEDYATRTQHLVRRAQQQRHMAVMQADHKRLGSISSLRALDPHLLGSISRLSLR